MANGNMEGESLQAAAAESGERISKHIARAGIASRRDIERMIVEGRVTLNGVTLTSPVILVKPGDRITIDGNPLPARQRTRLFLYHKPVGLVTTEKDPEGRPTVFSALPAGLPRVVSIGRLDINTEGLLLLTNDGGLARVLAHPMTGWLRRYRVRAFGEITQHRLDDLRAGIEIEGIRYGPIEARVDREQGSNMWLTLGLREGKNREVKRILEHFGLKVNRLIRVSFGPFQLGELAERAVDEVRTRTLKDQLGPALIRKANAFFDNAREGPRRSNARGEPATRGEEQMPRPLNEERPTRKAVAVAQGRRNAAHRHSWRDTETWALRGGRQARSSDSGKAQRPQTKRRDDDRQQRPDHRTHVRGGRIADRHGRSILVERIASDFGSDQPAPRQKNSQPRERQDREPTRPWANTNIAPLGKDTRQNTWKDRGRTDRQGARLPPKWTHRSESDRPQRGPSQHAMKGRADGTRHFDHWQRRPDEDHAEHGERPNRGSRDRSRRNSGPPAVRNAKDLSPKRFGRPNLSKQGNTRFIRRGAMPRAYSGEMASGSPQKMRQEQKTRAPVRFKRTEKGSGGFKPAGQRPAGGRASRPGGPPRGRPSRKPRN